MASALLQTLIPVLGLGLVSAASAQSPVTGVVESYFYETHANHGLVHRLTWGELSWRPTKNIKLLASAGVYPGGHFTDEAYAALDRKDLYLRAGRMRTRFGFSDWSDLYYNGFNALPLVRTSLLSDGLFLSRDDAGVEATTSIKGVSIEVAAVDSSLHRDELLPDRVDTAIVRLEAPLGPLIVGLDALRRFDGDGRIYGFDVRYTAPRLVGRLEYFNGEGPGGGQGGYVDVQYRPPRLPRTQLVGRTEYVRAPFEELVVRHTVGVRQIFVRYLQVNLNYSWGTGLKREFAIPAAGVDNFSLRAMFQVQF